MGLNTNWTRWVFASVADHIHTTAKTASLPMVIDLLNVRSDAWKNAVHRAEATISGPNSIETSNNQFDISVAVVIVVASHRQVSDRYVHLDRVGAMAAALDQCILVRDYPASTIEVGRLTPSLSVENSTEHLTPSESDNLIFSTIEAEFFGQFSQ